MNRFERYANLTAVVLPFLAFIAAVTLLWNRAVGPTELAILAAFYLVGGFGVTIGFHRLLTHRAFQTHKWVEYTLAVMGSLTLQGPVISWVADHRKHHAHTDQEGDPHSPHTGHEGGLRGALHGLWYAHVGWLWHTQGQADRRRYARELMEDPGMRAIQRAFPWLAIASFALPLVAGYVLTGTLGGALAGLLWGGLVRIFLLHHITWSINSVCHFFGRRRFEVDDESTNVFWLAIPSLGEAWHHNHHAFPRSAKHGLRWWEVDISGAVIALLERLGLAWQVMRIAPERQRQKLTDAAPPRSADATPVGT
jgi:stearoyl-CoA desaturase (delta-9 desaturase)